MHSCFVSGRIALKCYSKDLWFIQFRGMSKAFTALLNLFFNRLILAKMVYKNLEGLYLFLTV